MLAGQTKSATTLDLFLPTSGDRPSYFAMMERRDSPSWLCDDDDDDDDDVDYEMKHKSALEMCSILNASLYSVWQKVSLMVVCHFLSNHLE